MRNTLIIQNIDLWEAWIDMQTDGSKTAGTLYVIGDITISNNITDTVLVKRKASNSPNELSLEIVPDNITEDGYVVEIFYSESLTNIEQYDVITIYAGNDLLVIITDIEKLF